MIENWKPVVGYESCYEVSNLGRIRSVNRQILKSNGVIQNRSGRIKSQRITDDGYLSVGLSACGVQKKYYVHDIVARAFVDGYMDGLEVNHKDFNRTNNNSENLEWVTHMDNVSKTIDAGRHITQIRSMANEQNPNYGNHTLSDKYSSDKLLSKKKQSRPGIKNGRCKKIVMTCNDVDLSFGYILECANYLIVNGMTQSTKPSCVASNISKVLDRDKSYLGIKFRCE